MDGPRDYHTKWSKLERERQIPYDIIYMGNLKCVTNEATYEREKDSQTYGQKEGDVRKGCIESL